MRKEHDTVAVVVQVVVQVEKTEPFDDAATVVDQRYGRQEEVEELGNIEPVDHRQIASTQASTFGDDGGQVHGHPYGCQESP